MTVPDVRQLQRQIEVLHVTGLVRVDEDQIERRFVSIDHRAQRLAGAAHAHLHPIGYPGPIEIMARHFRVFLDPTPT